MLFKSTDMIFLIVYQERKVLEFLNYLFLINQEINEEEEDLFGDF